LVDATSLGSLFLPSRLRLRYCSSGFCGLLARGGRLQAQAFKLQALQPSISALKPFIAALELQLPQDDRKTYPKTITSHCKPPQAPASPHKPPGQPCLCLRVFFVMSSSRYFVQRKFSRESFPVLSTPFRPRFKFIHTRAHVQCVFHPRTTSASFS
jgi:hypothetical protein